MITANNEIQASAEESGPYETAAYPVVRDEADAMFFVVEEDGGDAPEGDAVDFDIMADLAAGEEAEEESVAEVFVGEEPEAVAEAAETAPEPEAEASSEPEAAAEESVADAVCEPLAPSEMSADYIPGAEAEEASVPEPAPGPEAVAAPEPMASSEETSVFDAAQDTAQADIGAALRRLGEAQAMLTTETAVQSPANAPAIAALPDESARQETRRERRRRERAEKKKSKKAKSAAQTVDLPEIVLTRSEGTETLSVTDEAAEAVNEIADETAEEAIEEILEVAEEVPQEAIDKEAPAPRMSEPVSLLTPNDVIEDDSRIVDEAENESAGENNVILFNEKFPVFAGTAFEEEEEYQEEESAELASLPFLRMLPQPETEEIRAEETAPAPEEFIGEAEEGVAEGIVAETGAAGILDGNSRQALIRAMLGAADPEDCLAEEPVSAESAEGGIHTILAPEPEPAPTAEELIEATIARETAARDAAVAAARDEAAEELEQTYQLRLDAFAARLQDAQSLAAASEARAREKRAELDAAAAELADVRDRLALTAAENRKLADTLETARGETRRRDEELSRFSGMREEHERLYREFEDLRRAYNEVVVDVMPGLQAERDDLALTVERQCENETALRTTLGSVRKRLAAGYALAGAACLAFVALPMAGWLGSGKDDQRIALERQRITELETTLQREVRQNVDSQNAIVELENQVEMAQAQILDLQDKNIELTRVAGAAPRANSLRPNSRSQELAVFAPSAEGAGMQGTPTRASDMALQATMRPGEKLRVNEVRDPAGSIEQVIAMNREQRLLEEGGSQLAQASNQNRNQGAKRPIAMSAVATKDSRNGARTASQAKPQAKALARAKQPSPKARAGEVLAKVKKGEGVAQVVYRELGTWDPAVISWVIHENKIPLDKRGNPRIHPDQTLRLPREGRIAQSASR